MGALLSNLGKFVFVGGAGWLTGFFSGDGGKWWVIAFIVIALLAAAYYFFGRS